MVPTLHSQKHVNMQKKINILHIIQYTVYTIFAWVTQLRAWMHIPACMHAASKYIYIMYVCMHACMYVCMCTLYACIHFLLVYMYASMFLSACILGSFPRQSWLIAAHVAQGHWLHHFSTPKLE